MTLHFWRLARFTFLKLWTQNHEIPGVCLHLIGDVFAKDDTETPAKGAPQKYLADEEDEKDTVWYYCSGVYSYTAYSNELTVGNTV